MSFNSNYSSLRIKRLLEERMKKEGLSSNSNPTKFEEKYAELRADRIAQETEKEIAPVTTTKKTTLEAPITTKKEQERSYFQKGVFDDGWQAGDVSKAILGSGADIIENLGAGLLGMGESVVDAVVGLGALATKNGRYTNRAYSSYDPVTKKWIDNAREEATQSMTDFVAKDLYDEEKVAKAIVSNPIKAVTGVDIEDISILGEEADSLAQSGGQLLGTAALQAAGVPWWLTTGATSYGGEVENALNEGATIGEASLSAAISAGAEILTEKISGGISFGGKTLDDALTKQISRNISKKAVRAIAKIVVDMAGEGGEEVASEFISTLGKQLTYEKEQTWEELLTNEEAMDAYIAQVGESLFGSEAREAYGKSFLGGAILGGVGSVSNVVKSNKKGVDSVTGLTENEQKVVDKLYKDRVTEAEENGKITQKEKSKIYDSVLNDLEKGYISTDDIESILGGDTYKSYKDTIDSEDALKQELEELRQMKNGDRNDIQNDRLAELKAMNLDDTSKRDSLKSKLSEEVFGLAKDSRLAESYNEQTRRGQYFEADLSNYDKKYQDIIQKAVNSKTLNNTNRTHELVDMIAKISADKGVSFDFTNNAKLKESGFGIDGKTINGYVTKDGITLNIDSAKYLNSVVGHEVTHVLEGTELYKELQNTLIEYAKTKNDYQGRFDSLTELYKGVEGADINAELTADLVGDYLFTDSDFINKLSTEHRNVFQKIYDEIKYLYKVATAGSKEARELEKVKRAFDKAYKESGNVAIAFSPEQIKSVANTNPTTDPDIRYSLSSIANTFFGDENMSAYEFAKADYRQTQGYKDYVNQCINNFKQTRRDYDEGAAKEEIEGSIDGIVRVAMAAKQAGYDIYDDPTKRNKRDSKKRLLFSSLEPNSDYFTSSDISTICDKRKNFAEIYDDIVRAEEAKGVPQGKRFFDNVDNYFYLHKLMADKGLTQPCRECYVESMRKNLAPMASAFLRLVGETNPINIANDQLYQQKGKNKGQIKTNNAKTREWVLEKLAEYDMTVGDLTIETLTTEYGLAQLKIQAPMVYEAFNSFYGQSKPKMPKGATPFRFGELTALLTDEKGNIKQSLVDKINSTGGFRLQSYSDFQIQNYTDVLQVIFEAGTLGLNGHAYTKVPAFLDATEGTNLKRNISIFMYKDGNEWKLDRNDSFPYTLEEIYDIVKADKSGNTSIIAVSQNEDMSAWIMANDFIGYGIPFHKSGLKMNTVRDTIVKEDGREIKGYSGTKDHTKQQTEVWAKSSEDHKALTKVKNGINIYSFWDFDNKANLSKNELIEKNVKAYIDACDKAGYLPRFREYVINNSKVLNNVLEYSKKLGSVSQDATIEDISFEYKGYTIPYGYYKFLGDFGMFTPDGKASPHEVLSLKNYDFDKAVEFFADSETLRRNEILQQFANGEERQRYRDSDLSAEELERLVRQRRGEIVGDVVGYSLSNENDLPTKHGNLHISGEDVAYQGVAPVKETDAKKVTEENIFPDDYAPMTEQEAAELQREMIENIDDADAPPEREATYPDVDYANNSELAPDNPFEDRDIKEVGNRKIKAYMYENPEVKPFFQAEARVMLGELQNSTKGERWYNDSLYYETNGEKGFGGTKRITSEDIAYLLDEHNYTYAEIEKGLNAIIEDNGKENNACSKRIEFLLDERLRKGYNGLDMEIPPNQDYINLLNEKQITEYNEESFRRYLEQIGDAVVPKENVAPIKAEATPAQKAPTKEYEAIKPKPQKQTEPRMVRADTPARLPQKELRSWAETSTESKALDGQIPMEELDQSVIHYQPISNKKTLDKANSKLNQLGYDKSVTYFEGRFAGSDTKLEDIVLGERLVQEAVKRGDNATAMKLIQDISILGTELGQKVQALSIIQRLTPEGQLAMLNRIVERGKAKGDKTFEGVELTQEQANRILETRKEDGTYDQAELNAAVEDVKQQIADKMSVTAGEKINAWRYLAMLGNPKTHIRNIVSNVAMYGTTKVKNVVARTIEDIFLPEAKLPTKSIKKTETPINKTVESVLPNGIRVRAKDRGNVGTIQSFNAATGKYTVYFKNDAGQTATVKLDANLIEPLIPLKKTVNKTAEKGKSDDIAPVRTKTRKKATKDVEAYAKQVTEEMQNTLSGDSKYSVQGDIKAKRRIYKNATLNYMYELNSKWLTKEDTIFKNPAFENSFREYLTANGIRTNDDIKNYPEIVEKGKQYAMEQALIATFQQESWLANKIGELESKNAAYGVAVGAIMPFKKTPINIAKTGLMYSPLGFAKSAYDAIQVKSGDVDASTFIDGLSKNLTGTALMFAGYLLAKSGVLSGAGDDDKEGKYDYQLGEQGYSLKIGDQTFSLSWLTPVSMPLFVGANAYEQLEEDKGWSADVVMETLAQTLDPLSEMSFLSSLDNVLSSYDSGVQKFMGIGESMLQNYATQFVPTLSSQIAAVTDDTKRTTKVGADSGFRLWDETVNQIKYKIPGLRQTLEPATDIWGNEVKQSGNILTRAFESAIAPYSRKEDITTEIDEEIKSLYKITGDESLIPTIPRNYINYKKEKYEMSASEHTAYKQTYGQTAYALLDTLFKNSTYRNATDKERADMIGDVYDYARDEANREYLAGKGVDYTNTSETDEDTKIVKEFYRENFIKGAIENDVTAEEYGFSFKNPEKYAFFKDNGISYGEYAASEESKEAYSWAFNNPEKYTLSKAVASDVVTYKTYSSELYDIKADKDENGKSITGSRKEKVVEYINNLDADYGEKIILFKSEYNADDTYNYEIIDYLNSRDDISYTEMETILKELGFNVSADGTISWD